MTNKGGIEIRLLALCSLILLSACQLFPTDPILTAGGELNEFVAKDGVLSVTLVAAPKSIVLDKVQISGQVYNDDYPGPLLRVHPGDTLRIKLVNHLTEPTNLHFHGYQGTPLGNSDNMHISVMPGQSFDYTVIIPKTQPPGFYWYHDHTHGLAEKHIKSGLSGGLEVMGFAEQFSELKGITERLFVLKDYEIEDSTDPYVLNELHEYIQTFNGQTFFRAKMRPGETQLWRFMNSSANLYFHLMIKDHIFRMIGDDAAAMNQEIETKSIDVKPASRVDFLVTAGAPGEYDIVSDKVLTGDKSQRVVGHLTIAGPPAPSVPKIAKFPAIEDLRMGRIDERRTFVLTQLNDDKNYFINSKKFDHARLDTRVPLGNIEEWTIRNDTGDLHVFYIHQLAFQVIEVNGVVQPFTGRVDVARVPEKGSIKILMPFTDPLIVGQFMYHCHVLHHEDNGMMATIEVYDPKAVTGPSQHQH
jgi:FtsP/CotA-like multicopper oxidase with cupredoxin domain